MRSSGFDYHNHGRITTNGNFEFETEKEMQLSIEWPFPNTCRYVTGEEKGGVLETSGEATHNPETVG
jgi:hypothetical protein